MPTTVVNLYAGPGAGKSTTAAGVFSLLKLHGVNAELVTEFAKDLTWEGSQAVLANQDYVLGQQYHRLWRLNGKVDIIVTDSPLLLSLVYGDTSNWRFVHYVESLYSNFNNVNYFIERVKPYQEAGRNQTEDEARDLDRSIRDMLDSRVVTYDVVPGDISGINTIVQDLVRYQQFLLTGS
ncbi:AAA family ATPase [Nitrolancea hollandica]|uniref:NadR/Ttd14 AAA domain-containing protein n=1 Tax=Nitrolancea hollandica Lb TaxID=1129897 RepID=I4EMH4_9BACT|nr:AAA family ATPase [Nitrolancea hollandica]CCF85887.1 conserved hypothetical protein [Nitrolancea hollandica Lb]